MDNKKLRDLLAAAIDMCQEAHTEITDTPCIVKVIEHDARGRPTAAALVVTGDNGVVEILDAIRALQEQWNKGMSKRS